MPVQKIDGNLMLDKYRKGSIPASNFFIDRGEFGLGRDLNFSLVPKEFLTLSSPLFFDHSRYGIVTGGKFRLRINLVEHELSRGSLMMINGGSMIEPIEATEDFRLTGMFLSPEMFESVMRYHAPENFSRQFSQDMKIGETELRFLESLFSLLWDNLHLGNKMTDTARFIAGAIISYIDSLAEPWRNRQQERRSSAATMFENFITLVNQNAIEHHQMDFYADKLCVTPRHLGSVVHKFSGTTAKEWIDNALVARAKILLEYSDKTVSEISDELNFPNNSFFCKFFKRLTGMSPEKFRGN